MSTTTVIPFSIKWGKETISLSMPLEVLSAKSLKTELEEKTGVPTDRMKLMPKSKGLWKGILKDDFDVAGLDWNAILKNAGGGNSGGGGGAVSLLLMGSATKLAGPKTKTVFLEDLPPEEIAKVQEPSGLVNLGNTCYLNSVVQCLRTVQPLRRSLRDYYPNANNNNNNAAAAAAAAAAVPPSVSAAAHPMLMSTLRDTYEQMDRQSEAMQPMQLVQTTKMSFPQFAQRNPQTGHPMQQDAEEFFSGLLTVASKEMSDRRYVQTKYFDRGGGGPDTTTGDVKLLSDDELMGAKNIVDALFGMKMKEVLTCDETDQEPPVVTYDLHRKLVCNIQGGGKAAPKSSAEAAAAAAAASASGDSPPEAAAAVATSVNATTNVNYINEGILLSLQGKIEKQSDVLGRNALWTRKQRVDRLSPFIVTQFGRFYWKATPESADHLGVKCKVMKPVAFNTILDMYDFCTPEIQSVLKISRDRALKEEEDRITAKLKGQQQGEGKSSGDGDAMDVDEKDDDKKKEAEEAATKTAGGNDDDDDNEEDEALKAALAMSMETEPTAEGEKKADDTARPGFVGPGLPEQFQGLYELFAVVTHKGRDADGGHYMAWVKADYGGDGDKSGKNNGGKASASTSKIADTDTDNEDWFVFDDDEVSPCKTEDVLKLKGGGDWHMSYLNFYRAKK